MSSALKDKLTEQLFKRIFETNFEKLCFYAYSFSHDSEVARDICQESFIALWEKFQGSEEIGHFVPFLYLSVKNGCLNHCRHQDIAQRYEKMVVDHPELSDDHPAEESDKLYKILDAIGHLPEQRRKIFLLNSMQEMKYKEIADELNISVNTVKTHLLKAYRFIRAELTEVPDQGERGVTFHVFFFF